MHRTQSLIGWIALSVLLVSVLPSGSVQPVAWLGLSLVVLLLFAAQMIVDWRDPFGGAYRADAALPTLLCALVLVWAVFQLSGLGPALWHNPAWRWVDADGAIAVDPDAGRQSFARLTAYVMVFWLAARSASDEARARQFVRAIAVWTALVVVYGLIAFVLRANPLTGETAMTLTGTLVNRNHYATYAGIGVLASVATLSIGLERIGLDRVRRHRLRAVTEYATHAGWLYGLCAVMNLGALVLTQSRGGLLAIIAALATFFVAGRGTGRAPRVRLRFAAFGVTVMVAYAALIGLGGVLERFATQGADDARTIVFPSVLRAVADNVVLGVGLGGFGDAFWRYLSDTANTGVWDAAHNAYLENALELGVAPATALYLALAIIAFRLHRGVGERRRSAALPAFALSVVVLGALHSLVDFSLQIPAVAALFAFVLGLGFVQSYRLADRAAATRGAPDTSGPSLRTGIAGTDGP